MKLTLRSLSLLFLLLWQLPLLAATVTIKVGDNFYSPKDTTISPGDVVVFRLVGSGVHPTVSETGAWAPFVISPSSPTGTVQFFRAGSTYAYYCSAHSFVNSDGKRQGMIGSIRVGAVATPTFPARALNSAFSLSPNPSHGLVTVSVAQFSVGKDYRLRLSNIIGREVRTVAVRPEAAEGGMTLNLADLPAGMYFYSLLQNDKVISTKRLVLQN